MLKAHIDQAHRTALQGRKANVKKVILVEQELGT